MARRQQLTVVNQETGEVKEVTQVPYQVDGKGYTMQSHGAEVPLYALGLTGAEWSMIDWLREHGAASEPIRVDKDQLAEDINSTEPTVKRGLRRLVTLGVTMRTAPRSGTYQLNPRRYWEGSGATQSLRVARNQPPRVAPDAKAAGAAKKTSAAKKDATGKKKTAGANVRSIEGSSKRRTG